MPICYESGQIYFIQQSRQITSLTKNKFPGVNFEGRQETLNQSMSCGGCLQPSDFTSTSAIIKQSILECNQFILHRYTTKSSLSKSYIKSNLIDNHSLIKMYDLRQIYIFKTNHFSNDKYIEICA